VDLACPIVEWMVADFLERDGDWIIVGYYVYPDARMMDRCPWGDLSVGRTRKIYVDLCRLAYPRPVLLA